MKARPGHISPQNPNEKNDEDMIFCDMIFSRCDIIFIKIKHIFPSQLSLLSFIVIIFVILNIFIYQMSNLFMVPLKTT